MYTPIYTYVYTLYCICAYNCLYMYTNYLEDSVRVSIDWLISHILQYIPVRIYIYIYICTHIHVLISDCKYWLVDTYKLQSRTRATPGRPTRSPAPSTTPCCEKRPCRRTSPATEAYICMCIYMYLSLSLYIYIYICVGINIYIYIYIYIRIYIYIHVIHT